MSTNGTTPEEYMRLFSEVLDYMKEITKAKNHDYSGTESAFKNFEMVEGLGICTVEEGILVRITDKISRISNLIKSEAKVKDEKITDTLLDLAIYSIILKIYLETKNK